MSHDDDLRVSHQQDPLIHRTPAAFDVEMHVLRLYANDVGMLHSQCIISKILAPSAPDLNFAKCMSVSSIVLSTMDKFPLIRDLATEIEYATPRDTLISEAIIHIEDGNAIVHSLKCLPPTFSQICLKTLQSLQNKDNVVRH